MSNAADRNLLLGIIALQMDFVGRDALILAMHAWVLDKATPLGRILEAQGVLTAARRDLLEALVEEHIRLHDGDPRRSLAALSSVGSLGRGLSVVGDAEVQASLALASAGRTESADPSDTASVGLGSSTSGGARFRILRPHARGGLGQVSVALDQELDRHVALKEIQDRHADEPKSRARFVREAEVTGKLEHPGIVPVYGLGHDATGRPFYAMRFIRGDSLKEAIAAFHADETSRRDPPGRSARLRELLRRFADVCNAVAYAHSRGVLHRDLKPGNIMLGPYGETLVVDWGLAKPMGDGRPEAGDEAGVEDRAGPSFADAPIRLSRRGGSSAETMAGSPIGTPAFASPEQVLGRLDRLGPASDVYGLGATLYALLTGRAPVGSRDLEEVLGRVARGEIPPPRTIDPTIPRPLEAICLKAMAFRPEDRYPSARALAEDVKRWMDDAPVSACRDPLHVRTARWARRHQRLVTGTAAVVLVGLSALGIAYSREARINETLRRANAEADRRLDQTLLAIEDYYTGVGAELLLNQAEFRDLRARLLEKPRRFYEQLARELAQARTLDDRARSLLAKGRNGLGLINQALARYGEALSELKAANVLLREDVAASPRDADRRFALALNESQLGLVSLLSGDYAPGEGRLREAMSLFRELRAEDPARPAFLKGLAENLNHTAVLRQYVGDTPGSMAALREAFDIWATLVDRHPDVPEYLLGLCLCVNNLGFGLSDTGDWREAERSLDRAVELLSKLLASRPDMLAVRSALVRAHTGQGQHRMKVGNLNGARECFGRAIALGTKTTEAAPNALFCQYSLALAYYERGVLDIRTGNPQGAAESMQESVRILEGLTRRDPDSVDYQAWLARGYAGLGDVRIQLGDTAGAAGWIKRSIAIYSGASQRQSNVFVRDGLASSLIGLGVVQRRGGDGAGAEASFRRAISMYAESSQAHPEIVRYRYLASNAWNELGEVQRQSERLDDARASYEQARSGLHRLVREHPDSIEYKKLLAGVLTNLGLVDMKQGRTAQGLQRFQEALTYWKEPFARNPRDPFFSSGLREAPRALSNLLGSKSVQQPARPAPPPTPRGDAKP